MAHPHQLYCEHVPFIWVMAVASTTLQTGSKNRIQRGLARTVYCKSIKEMLVIKGSLGDNLKEVHSMFDKNILSDILTVLPSLIHMIGKKILKYFCEYSGQDHSSVSPSKATLSDQQCPQLAVSSAWSRYS